MSMSNLNSAWQNDLYPLVAKRFELEYADYMNLISPLFEEVDSDSIDYRVEALSGFGELPAYTGTDLTAMNQRRGYITTITPEEYAGTIDIHYKRAKVDRSGEIKKVGTRAARSAAMTVYMHMMRMFENAYSAEHKGADGCPWATTEHPVATVGDDPKTWESEADVDAGTYSNLIIDELSVAAITKAQSKANRFLTPDGLPFLCDMDTLLVSPELEAKAKELCGPDTKLIPERLPETNENGANPIYGMGYIVIKGFSAKQWAVCDRALMREAVKLVYITRPTVLKGVLDNPLVSRFVPYADFGMGWGDARQIVFSSPA